MRSWRGNEIRPFAACNHSTDRHGFGCQQLSEATVAAIKWLKSLFLSEWCDVGEKRRGGGWPQNAWNSDYFTSEQYSQYNSLSLLYCLKNKKDEIWFRARLNLCVGVCVSTCVFLWQMCVCFCAHAFTCGNSFYKRLWCREAIVCAPSWRMRSPHNGCCPADEKKINRNAIVSEAMSRISTGVWG